MADIDKQPFEFEDRVDFKQKASSGGRCAKCCVCFVMLLALLLAFLSVAAVVVFGVLYWQLVINEAVVALEDRIVDLEMQLNESQAMADSQMVMMALEDRIVDLEMQLNESQAMAASQMIQAMGAMQNLEARFNESTQNLTTQINNRIATVTDEIADEVGQVRTDLMQDVSNAQRTAYIRWGHDSCPDVAGTTLLYNGKIGAASFAVSGSGANHLCMPSDPEYTLPFQPGTQARSLIYGTEYQFNDFETTFDTTPTDDDVACAVCSVSTRTQMVMIPAKASCPTDWTMEYQGYIMADGLHGHRTNFICVDSAFVSAGSGFHQETSDLWLVEASCMSFDCNNGYNGEGELNCVVCTK